MKSLTIALSPVAVVVGMHVPVAWLVAAAVPGLVSIVRRKAHWILCL